MEPSSSGLRRPQSSSKKKQKTTILALNHDILCLIFGFLDLVQLIRCSAVCKSWSRVIDKLKLLQMQYHKQQHVDPLSLSEGRSLIKHMEEIAIQRHRFSLQRGPANAFQWKGHLVGVNKCRMKMGLVLTGVGDKVMRLWSVESYNCLDEYALPDKAPLIDFDFDEGKVVGLVGSRICIWTRTGTRNVFSSRDGMFTRGLCMSYVDPEAVVGCEDGKARVFDMYSRKCSQIVKMHPGPITCLSFSDDQLLICGSSLGSISVSDLSSDQRVTTLKSFSSAGIKTLCLNPRSNVLFAGSTDGHAYCWDIRTLRTLWERRVSTNVLYSISHLRNDASTLVIGGIDGVVRILDQDTGEVLSRCIMDEAGIVSTRPKDRYHQVIKMKKVQRLSEDARIDLMPVTSRPPITSLAVGMQKVVTLHNDKCVRVWKFMK
ncbi:hypothetical protein ACH5RR_000910 [Cinchona calisaya]|uniref:F-box domain-containing protein n=1 Tax=Cinchona calisaya TaxID=153742 RepID=A0ABD3B323_9GENT